MRSVFAFVLLLAAPLQAELRLSTLTEAQVGNLPGAQPSDLRTIYHQFSLDYAVADLRFGVRGETFGASAASRNYGELLQRSAVYRRSGFEATLGNFYTIVGSGLLLHAFELPGVITEERGRRRRYQIVRDLDGVQVRYRAKRAEVLLLRGAPVNSTLPPGLEGVERRPDALQAGSLQLKSHPHFDVGVSAIRYAIGRGQETSAAFNARWRLAPVLARLGLAGVYADLQGEYAQRDVALKRFFSLDRSLGRALYLAATLASGPWGLSLEYKDYEDFALEHINNPPPLIREHSAYLLNRITHDVLADDEQGYQAELSYVLPSGQTLTANATRATRRRDLGAADDDVLREFFVEVESSLGHRADVQLFADFNHNKEIRLDDKSRLLGTRWAWSPDGFYSFEFDAQFQDVDRWFGTPALPDAQFQDVDQRFGRKPYPYTNHYYALAVHRAPSLSAAVQIQRTSDELETGADPSGITWWRGLNIGADIGEGHIINVFAGQRRSGLACTAGICYEVLGFKGVEVRLLNRFF